MSNNNLYDWKYLNKELIFRRNLKLRESEIVGNLKDKNIKVSIELPLMKNGNKLFVIPYLELFRYTVPHHLSQEEKEIIFKKSKHLLENKNDDFHVLNLEAAEFSVNRKGNYYHLKSLSIPNHHNLPCVSSGFKDDSHTQNESETLLVSLAHFTVDVEDSENHITEVKLLDLNLKFDKVTLNENNSFNEVFIQIKFSKEAIDNFVNSFDTVPISKLEKRKINKFRLESYKRWCKSIPLKNHKESYLKTSEVWRELSNFNSKIFNEDSCESDKDSFFGYVNEFLNYTKKNVDLAEARFNAKHKIYEKWCEKNEVNNHKEKILIEGKKVKLTQIIIWDELKDMSSFLFKDVTTKNGEPSSFVKEFFKEIDKKNKGLIEKENLP